MPAVACAGIAAAQAYLDAGDSDASSRLAEEAHAGAYRRRIRRRCPVRGALELQRGTPATAYDLLLAAAHAVAGEDPARALELQAEAITPAFVAGWPERAFCEAHAFVGDLPPTGRPFESFLRMFLGAMVAAGPEAGTPRANNSSRPMRVGAARTISGS